MKSLGFIVLVCSALALAGGYSAKAVVQSGNGTNGMTYTPLTDAGDVAPAFTASWTGQANSTCAQVTVQAASTNNIQSASGISWLRCNEWGPSPTNTANFSYRRCPQYDFQIDAGASENVLGNIYTYNIGEVPYGQNNSWGYLWACENCQQSGTLDAGMTVLTELTSGNGNGGNCKWP